MADSTTNTEVPTLSLAENIAKFYELRNKTSRNVMTKELQGIATQIVTTLAPHLNNTQISKVLDGKLHRSSISRIRNAKFSYLQ